MKASLTLPIFVHIWLKSVKCHFKLKQVVADNKENSNISTNMTKLDTTVNKI